MHFFFPPQTQSHSVARTPASHMHASASRSVARTKQSMHHAPCTTHACTHARRRWVLLHGDFELLSHGTRERHTGDTRIGTTKRIFILSCTSSWLNTIKLNNGLLSLANSDIAKGINVIVGEMEKGVVLFDLSVLILFFFFIIQPLLFRKEVESSLDLSR